MIVLDTTRCSHGRAGCFDEGGHRTRDAQPSSSQILLGEKNAVNEAANIVLEQYLGELLAVDRPFFQAAEFCLQVVEELPVLSLQQVRTVDAMRFKHRVRQERPLAGHSD